MPVNNDYCIGKEGYLYDISDVSPKHDKPLPCKDLMETIKESVCRDNRLQDYGNTYSGSEFLSEAHSTLENVAPGSCEDNFENIKQLFYDHRIPDQFQVIQDQEQCRKNMFTRYGQNSYGWGIAECTERELQLCDGKTARSYRECAGNLERNKIPKWGAGAKMEMIFKRQAAMLASIEGWWLNTKSKYDRMAFGVIGSFGIEAGEEKKPLAALGALANILIFRSGTGALALAPKATVSGDFSQTFSVNSNLGLSYYWNAGSGGGTFGCTGAFASIGFGASFPVVSKHEHNVVEPLVGFSLGYTF